MVINNKVSYLQRRQIDGPRANRPTDQLRNVLNQIAPKSFRDLCTKFYTQYKEDIEVKKDETRQTLDKFLSFLGLRPDIVSRTDPHEIIDKHTGIEIIINERSAIVIQIYNNTLRINMSTHDIDIWIQGRGYITFVLYKSNTVLRLSWFHDHPPEIRLSFNNLMFIYSNTNHTSQNVSQSVIQIQTNKLVDMFIPTGLKSINQVLYELFDKITSFDDVDVYSEDIDKYYSVWTYINWFRPEFDTMDKIHTMFVRHYKYHTNRNQQLDRDIRERRATNEFRRQYNILNRMTHEERVEALGREDREDREGSNRPRQRPRLSSGNDNTRNFHIPIISSLLNTLRRRLTS